MTASKPQFIASEIYRHSRYGTRHPLAIPRVSTVVDLCRSLGWLPDDVYHDGPVAKPEELTRFHEPAYIEALRDAEREGLSTEEKERWRIGIDGNPIYSEVYRRPATAAGSSMLAAELLAEGGIVHSPAGGTHHGRPDRAAGFCFLNDPVLGILRMRELGLRRIAYLDLDAHHGDGVEHAFSDDPDVFTISIHEAGRWPGTGHLAESEFDRGIANLPVPPGFHDFELTHLMAEVVLPLLDRFAPEALVVQAGVDGLAEDPQSKLSLSNRAFVDAISAVRGLSPRLLVLGGGGYNPWAVGRAWSAIWATLNQFPIPDTLPAPAEAILRAITWRHRLARNPPEHWFQTLLDPPSGKIPVRGAILTLAKEARRRLGSAP